MVGTLTLCPPYDLLRFTLRLVGAFLAAGLEQEPGAALGFVDEGFKQSRGAGIPVLDRKSVV